MKISLSLKDHVQRTSADGILVNPSPLKILALAFNLRKLLWVELLKVMLSDTYLYIISYIIVASLLTLVVHCSKTSHPEIQ